jgi:hypothetical protein
MKCSMERGVDMPDRHRRESSRTIETPVSEQVGVEAVEIPTSDLLQTLFSEMGDYMSFHVHSIAIKRRRPDRGSDRREPFEVEEPVHSLPGRLDEGAGRQADLHVR